MFYILVFLLCLISSYAFFHFHLKRNPSLEGEHFMITGGSKGIGLAFAIEVVKQGASVTLLARNKEHLQKVKEIHFNGIPSNKQKISIFSLDVSLNSPDLKEIVNKAEDIAGPITFLINCAGSSSCHRFEETPEGEFERLMNTNFFGSVYITQAIVPLMKQRRKGRIVFFSSLAGLIGIYGYSAYSASKFALVGMAEALDMELNAYGIKVTLAFPPDTDTPGFAEEMKTKLPETKILSESGGFFSAMDVAQKTLQDSLDGRFMSSVGLEGYTMCTLMSGCNPVASYLELMFQFFSMGLLRLIGYAYRADGERKLKKYASGKKIIPS